MQPHDMSTQTGSRPPSKNTMTRSVLTLVILVLIVGGIAWVIQYLPGRARTDGKKPEPILGKKLLVFERPVALWRKKIEPPAKDAAKTALPAKDPNPAEVDLFKDVEIGTTGHYDFLFKNLSEVEIGILFYASTCDCTSVKACVLAAEEWERVNKEQEEKPGEPLPYAKEPSWVDLPKRSADEPGKKPALLVKPDEAGVVRVEWSANKPKLSLQPGIVVRAAGDSRHYKLDLGVPVMARPPIQFDPLRVNAGVVSADKTTQTTFDVWSSTRPKLDFTLTSTEPQFVFEVKQLEKDEFAAKANELAAKEMRVLCAYRVSLTVHETKDGKHLDQGSFYRKFPFALDGKVDTNSTLWGPEIVGLVKGDIDIGGADDHGKILFQSFNVKTGGSKEVQLATRATEELKTYDGHRDQPSWIKVDLTRDEKQASSNRVTWQLRVTVEPNTIGVRSFAEPDAVVLQIVGTERFVRIPIEGHISR